MQSIHGQAIARGNELAPVCTDCHGIHSIKSHSDPNSPNSEQNLSRDTCARCHQGVRLSQELVFRRTGSGLFPIAIMGWPLKAARGGRQLLQLPRRS